MVAVDGIVLWPLPVMVTILSCFSTGDAEKATGRTNLFNRLIDFNRQVGRQPGTNDDNYKSLSCEDVEATLERLEVL